MTSGGVRTSAFVPVPWRSGTIVTEGSTSVALEQLAELGGVQRRAVAGHEQHAAGALLDGVVDPDQRGGALALLDVVDEHRGAVAAADRVGGRLGGDDEDARRRPRCGAAP